MIRYLLAGCLILIAAPSLGRGQASERTIEVRATGEVTVPVDELLLPLEISTAGDDIAMVKQRNDLLLKQLFELLATQKLPQPEIESTTASFDFTEDARQRSVVPKQQAVPKQQFRKEGKGEDPFGPPLAEDRSSFYMSRHLTLRFNDLSQATALLARLTAQDAVRKTREVRLSQLQVSVKDLAPHQSQARKLAVQLAKEKAELLAEASGLQLKGALRIFDETSSVYPRSGLLNPDPFGAPFGRHAPTGENSELSSPTVFVAYQEKKAPTEPDQLPPGQTRVTASVRIVYEAATP